MPDILGFDGDNRWCSNFIIGSVEPILSFISYPTVENAYQAAKTLDHSARVNFMNCSPVQAKKLGKTVVIRADWDSVKLDIMRHLVRQKFNCPVLRNKLLATGTCHIEETNYWKDTYWGVCNGVGENHMGKILMELRSSMR